jgi:hypothetical protein
MYTDYSGYIVLELSIAGTILLVAGAVYAAYLLTQAVSDVLPSVRENVDNEVTRVKDYVRKHALGMTIAATLLASRTVEDDYSVYLLFDMTSGDPLYVGITNNPTRRLSEHSRDPRFSSYSLEMNIVSEGQNYYTARMIEQILIESYRINTMVGVLNRRNSISPNRFRHNLPLYEFYTLVGR